MVVCILLRPPPSRMAQWSTNQNVYLATYYNKISYMYISTILKQNLGSLISSHLKRQKLLIRFVLNSVYVRTIFVIQIIYVFTAEIPSKKGSNYWCRSFVNARTLLNK